jgi:hypothetical protein
MTDDRELDKAEMTGGHCVSKKDCTFLLLRFLELSSSFNPVRIPDFHAHFSQKPSQTL